MISWLCGLCGLCVLCVDRRGHGATLAGSVRIMSQARQALGKLGEDLACRELERRGYEIVARRYRCRGGEIDIIARDGRVTVFVEVKAREGREFGDGAEAVGSFKRRRIEATALDYLARAHLLDTPCRFDVVSILVDDQSDPGADGIAREPHVEVYRNAFDVSR